MYPTILPFEVKAEEDSSLYYQRRTNRIVKSKKNLNPLIRLTTHFNHHHHHHRNNSDGTTSTTQINCGSCEKDNNESVMCMLTGNLQKFDFIRSRTKFPVAFHLIAWIVFLTVNIAYSNAAPVENLCLQVNNTISELKNHTINCYADISHCLKDRSFYTTIFNETDVNLRQTNFSMETLQSNMRAYQKIIGVSDIFMSDRDHFATYISNVTVSDLFKGSSFLAMFEKNLKLVSEHLYNITELLDFHLCRHTHANYSSKTISNMELGEDNKNKNIVLSLKGIKNYTSQSQLVIGDTLRRFFNFTEKSNQQNCTLHKNTSSHLEIMTMKQLEGTLDLISKIFTYIETAICITTK